MGKLRQWLDRPQVIQGMTLGTLLKVIARNGFQVHASCLGRLAYLLGFGAFNSVFAAYEQVFKAQDIDRVTMEHDPLFVMGHWRSGTTHLHNLLSLDRHFCAPTAFQALFPHHFLVSQVGGILFNLIAPVRRPMDNVEFGSDVPHEDEFALAAATAVSPYMRVLFPVTGDHCYTQLDPQRLPPAALDAWKEGLMLFLKKLTLSEGKRIVLKSPPHTGRVSTLLELFPNAQFVHIVRDPYAVYVSTRKLWKDSLAFAHLQVPEPDLVDEVILSWYTELFALFERDRDLIPAGALHELKFEDLEARPKEVLAEVYEALGLPGFDSFCRRLDAYGEVTKNYRKNVHRLDESDRAKVALRWSFAFDRYGYER
jgi:omega-hydroxy-beta-dihydromenaquinone-9 sulfotransferase